MSLAGAMVCGVERDRGCEAKVPSYNPCVALTTVVASLPGKWKSILLSPVSAFRSQGCVSLEVT